MLVAVVKVLLKIRRLTQELRCLLLLIGFSIYQFRSGKEFLSGLRSRPCPWRSPGAVRLT